mmetsp:Transcript_67008/g.118984  ORF Transcript_67008/g.118984 Transcript_67008/m.118984 type:complete len:309 (-) Transcript_67008:1251-2177(-)
MGCGCSRSTKVAAAFEDPAGFNSIVTLDEVKKVPAIEEAPVVWDTSKGSFPIHLLPNPVRLLLFQFIATPATIFSTMQVCHSWHECLTSDGDWQALCSQRYDSAMLKMLSSLENSSSMKWYMMDPCRNLIKHPEATTFDDHKKSWRICGMENSTKVFNIKAASELMTSGGMPIAPDAKCWATSSTKVHRKQTINLEASGFPLALLDSPDPPALYISEWFSGKGSTFRIKVKLLGEWTGGGTPQVILYKFDTGELKASGEEGADWQEAAATIEQYPKGLRYICFEDWSKDALLACPYVGFFRPPPKPKG